MRNAEYRLCFAKNLDLCERDLEMLNAENTKLDIQGLLLDNVNVIDSRRKNNVSSKVENFCEETNEDSNVQGLGEISAEVQQYIFNMQSRLSSMKKVRMKP